jgi:SAM-dependent methyltransferase
MTSIMTKLRPEIAAGGFARDDGIVSFYQRVNALLRSEMTVLDLGCGRGEIFQWANDSYRSELAKIQGKVAKVIGIDVDKAALHHPHLDECHVVEINDPLPLQNASVDVVISDWVLEHVDDPPGFISELRRVLKPEGWFCARTPNRRGYVGLGARIIPNVAHQSLLRILMPQRNELDVFPTVYKLNTLKHIKLYFETDKWDNYSFTQGSTPKYFGNSYLLFRIIELYQNIVPNILKTDIMIFIQKK